MRCALYHPWSGLFSGIGSANCCRECRFTVSLTVLIIAYYTCRIIKAFISCWFPVFYSFNVQFLGFNSYYYSTSITDLTDNLLVMTTLDDVFHDLVRSCFAVPVGHSDNVNSVLANKCSQCHKVRPFIWWRSRVSHLKALSSVTLPGPLHELQGATSWNGLLQITSEQCCTTCNDPDYPSPAGMLNNLEEYETNSLSNATIFYDHPSCDDSEVAFKTFVSTNYTNVGTSDRQIYRSFNPSYWILQSIYKVSTTSLHRPHYH